MFDLGIVFALISLFFSGLNDFVFKLQARGNQRCGQYLAVVGAVWMLVFAIGAMLQGAVYISPTAIKWGLIVGLVSAIANYLLIVSLRSLDASVGVTIYRLNLLAATIIAILFLGESVTVAKTLGVIAASIAVVLFSANDRSQRAAVVQWALVSVFSASLLRALVGIGYKLCNRELEILPASLAVGQSEFFLAVQGFVWMIVGLAVMKYEGETKLEYKSVNIGVLSGLLICGLVWFFNKALAIGDASVIIPVSQMSFLVTALLSRGFIKERFTGLKPVALAISVIAILMLSRA